MKIQAKDLLIYVGFKVFSKYMFIFKLSLVGVWGQVRNFSYLISTPVYRYENSRNVCRITSALTHLYSLKFYILDNSIIVCLWQCCFTDKTGSNICSTSWDDVTTQYGCSIASLIPGTGNGPTYMCTGSIITMVELWFERIKIGHYQECR